MAPCLLCFQKAFVFVGGGSADVAHSCQFADVQLPVFVGGIVAKEKSSLFEGEDFCFSAGAKAKRGRGENVRNIYLPFVCFGAILRLTLYSIMRFNLWEILWHFIEICHKMPAKSLLACLK